MRDSCCSSCGRTDGCECGHDIDCQVESSFAAPAGSVTKWVVKIKDSIGNEYVTEWDAVWKAEAQTGKLLSAGADEVNIKAVKSLNGKLTALLDDQRKPSTT